MMDSSILSVLSSHKEIFSRKEGNLKSENITKDKDMFKNLLLEKKQQVKNSKESNNDNASVSDSKINSKENSKDKAYVKKDEVKKQEKKDRTNEKDSILVESTIALEDLPKEYQDILNEVMLLVNEMEDGNESFSNEISKLTSQIQDMLSSEASNSIISSKEFKVANSILELFSLLENNTIDFKSFKKELGEILNSLSISNDDDLSIPRAFNSQLEYTGKKNQNENHQHNTMDESKSDGFKGQNQSNLESEKELKLLNIENTDSSYEKKDSAELDSLKIDFRGKDTTINNTNNIDSQFPNDLANIKNIVIEDTRTTISQPLDSTQNFNNVKNTVFNQIVEGFKLDLKDDSSEMLIKLKPDNLGDVSLKIAVERGIVIAKFDVENQIVKQAIESSLEDLKNSLNEKGFQIQELNVSVNKDPQKRHEFSGYRQRNKNKQKISSINTLVHSNYESINYIDPRGNLDGLSSTINYLG